MELHVEPRVTKTWDEFLEEKPNFSIALDGYVFGKPRFRKTGTYTNFNHHEEVDRLATRSTAGQVMIAIKQWLMDAFIQEDGKIDGHIFVNDADQDTCLAIWLLQNHSRIEWFKSEPLIESLITIEDLLDVTAGSYPIKPDSSTMQYITWIFDPYIQAKNTWELYKMEDEDMKNLIYNVLYRIDKYLERKGDKIELDTRYEKIWWGENWSMIIEQWPHARWVFFHDGIKAFVSFVDENEGCFTYSIWRISPYINFPIVELYKVLNEAEWIENWCADCWGGSNIIWGSPRKNWSYLKPSELETIINDFMEK